MRRVLMTSLALSAILAGTARANNGWQQTEQQRREIENKLAEMEREMVDLRRQLGGGREDGARTRVQVGPRAFAIAPKMTMFRKPKFGFRMEQIPDTAGVKVQSVTPASPAEKAGIRAGDVVTLFNGVKLAGLSDPASEVVRQGDNIEVGDTITVEFKHGTERKRVNMVAADLPFPDGYAYSYETEPGTEPRVRVMDMPEMFKLGNIPGGWLDVELVSLNKDLGEYFGATEGVLVIQSPRDSSLGLKAGDIILSIGGRKANTPSQALRVLRSYDQGETFEIQVLRQKRRVNVSAKVPERDRGFYTDWGNPKQ